MERFVQKWVEKVSKNYAKRVEKGPKIEPKWIQKSSKINAEIEVGKKFEKVTDRMAPVYNRAAPDFSFGHHFSGQNGRKRHPKNHEKVETEKVSKNDAKGSKRDAKCSQNGSQNLRKSI